ncbi:hypothetical protein N7468_001796 [Penicillium chermesinum]|uniref:Nuclear localization protein n=1 Tax=Penicillium chermesinum TaxID=63820 RepID=A0A9W9PHB1_9EURO|nr:uncharacterized protein N7468_001796 [Penicillium chermesinum]KAJ5246813.1 hypothetical protein N7468_001796 [Penicillium chermesinum]
MCPLPLLSFYQATFSQTDAPPSICSAGAIPAGTSPRGVKRSRTPDRSGNGHTEGDQDDEDQGRRKRGRPPKIPRANSNEQVGATPPIQTPQMQPRALPQNAGSPPLASPPDKTTPTKTLVKALPTVRDHTSDQLNEEGDEYIPKEFDEAGETKVDAMGYLQGNREYKCRTFRVPNRSTKLFMLATECARVLNYRDSYLLFNKNRSLHKIIASQIEKDDLIQQDILPYSYRSRQIAIVSARSMFRQFGSRVIVNGRRVRDDYWESKARKQGFTEDDLAGEKRPGASKVRDGAAADATSSLLPTLPHNNVIFSNTHEPLPPGLSLDVSDSSISQLSMLPIATSDDPRLRDYNSMARSRQELTGQTYQDRSQPSSSAEILNQASHAAEFNKLIGSQRSYRRKGLDEFYAKPREAPESEAQATTALDSGLSVSQPIQPAQVPPAGMVNPSQAQHVHHQAAMMAGQANFPQQAHQPPMGQQAVRGLQPGMRPDLMHQRSNPSMAGVVQPPYGYPPQHQPQQQVWGQPPSQPQQSPMSSTPQGVMPQQYAQHGQQMATAPQQTPSPLHHNQQPQQSPRNQPRPQVPQMPQQFHQMQHPQQQQAMAGMAFPGGNPAAYQGMARAMYPSAQAAPGGQPFMGNPQQASMAMGMGGGGMPGWPAGPGGPMQPSQPQPGQSGSPLGGWSGY